MPGIRPIKTENRQAALETMQQKLLGHLVNVEKIIEEMSRPNVDDKSGAKKITATAKKIQKALATATA